MISKGDVFVQIGTEDIESEIINQLVELKVKMRRQNIGLWSERCIGKESAPRMRNPHLYEIVKNGCLTGHCP